MVNIVGHRLAVVVQFDDVTDNGQNVVRRERPLAALFGEERFAETTIEARPTDGGKVVTFAGEKQSEKLAGVLDGGQIAVAESFVNFQEGIVDGFGVVFAD